MTNESNIKDKTLEDIALDLWNNAGNKDILMETLQTYVKDQLLTPSQVDVEAIKDEYFRVWVDGVTDLEARGGCKIIWPWIEHKLTQPTPKTDSREVKKIKNECSDVSMMLETTLGYIDMAKHHCIDKLNKSTLKFIEEAEHHCEVAQRMLGKVWMPNLKSKEIK